MLHPPHVFSFFFFNDTATTEIYTLSLHDALPICPRHEVGRRSGHLEAAITDRVAEAVDDAAGEERLRHEIDRKSTRLNSSHGYISYAVFCLKKKIRAVGIRSN